MGKHHGQGLHRRNHAPQLRPKRDISLERLDTTHLAELTNILRRTPGTNSQAAVEQWRQQQAKAIATLPPILRRPKGLFERMVAMPGSRPRQHSDSAPLCDSHVELNSLLIRKLGRLISSEIMDHVNKFRSLRKAAALPPNIERWLDRMEILTCFWIGPRSYTHIYKRPAATVQLGCAGDIDCVACMLAVAGGSPTALTDLRATLKARWRYSKAAHPGEGLHEPRLGRVLGLWIQSLDPGLQHRVREDSDALARELMKARHAFQSLYDQRREAKRRRKHGNFGNNQSMPQPSRVRTTANSVSKVATGQCRHQGDGSQIGEIASWLASTHGADPPSDDGSMDAVEKVAGLQAGESYVGARANWPVPQKGGNVACAVPGRPVSDALLNPGVANPFVFDGANDHTNNPYDLEGGEESVSSLSSEASYTSSVHLAGYEAHDDAKAAEAIRAAFDRIPPPPCNLQRSATTPSAPASRYQGVSNASGLPSVRPGSSTSQQLPVRAASSVYSVNPGPPRSPSVSTAHMPFGNARRFLAPSQRSSRTGADSGLKRGPLGKEATIPETDEDGQPYTGMWRPASHNSEALASLEGRPYMGSSGPSKAPKYDPQENSLGKSGTRESSSTRWW